MQAAKRYVQPYDDRQSTDKPTRKRKKANASQNKKRCFANALADTKTPHLILPNRIKTMKERNKTNKSEKVFYNNYIYLF